MVRIGGTLAETAGTESAAPKARKPKNLLGLTDKAVSNAKPKAKPYKLSHLDGLYLLVNPNGSKLWCWRRYHLDAQGAVFGRRQHPVTDAQCAASHSRLGRKKVSQPFKFSKRRLRHS